MIVTLFSFLFTAIIFLVIGKIFLIIYKADESKNYSVFDNYFIGLCLRGEDLQDGFKITPIK